MREIKRVPVTSLRPAPDQPWKQFDEAELLALGDNMKRLGQQVAAITFDNMILDGERRWRAALLVGIADLDVVELATRPTPTELLLLQMSLDAHRASLSAMERSDFLARLKQENNWSIAN